ncbi:MAG: carboxypeptidase regulatory-like domain-containing protein [Acidobacteria bacterium]|nr:carboxypeptidase regulatory-like domain-containing protein [Acidobacteriota bacterium]
MRIASPIRAVSIAMIVYVPVSLAQGTLQIQVNRGAAESYFVRERRSSTISVTVLDEKDRPVPGATVHFEVPPNGPSGSFADEKAFAITQTDSEGQASTTGFQANGLAGTYNIRVRASFEGKSMLAPVARTNEKRPFASKRNVTLIGAGAAAVIVPVLALRSTPPPKATISSVASAGLVGSP